MRLADRAVTTALAVVGILIVLALVLRAESLTAFTELSDSMAPAIRTGDLVLDRAVPATAVRPGQVVSLRDPVTGKLVTHRAVTVTRTGSRVLIVTRGDANTGSERWEVPAASHVQRMEHRVPHVGGVFTWLGAGALRLLLALAGAGLLGWAALSAVARSRSRR